MAALTNSHRNYILLLACNLLKSGSGKKAMLRPALCDHARRPAVDEMKSR
jgi:hypothetical protein